MTSYRSVGATVLVLAVVTLGACSSTVETEGPGASSAAATGSSAEAETPADSLSPKAFPEDDEPVAVEAGTYLVSGAVAGSDSALAGYTVTVPDGWTGDSGGDLKKDEDTPQGIGVSRGRSTKSGSSRKPAVAT